MAPTSPDITRLLRDWGSGSREAENELFTLVMPDLCRLARYLMMDERKGHSFQATELVNQIYVRLVAARSQDWQNRQHFFAIAARAMRTYLIDHARGQPGVRLTAFGDNDLLAATSSRLDLAITIDSLQDELEEIHPDWCRLVEVKYFLGLTDEETADGLGIMLRTLQRNWRDARQWLFERLESRNASRAAH